MPKAVILSAVRTAVGKFGGSLRQVTERTMASVVIKEALQKAEMNPHHVDEVAFACQFRTGVLPPNMARPVALDAGIPIETPQFTVAKACGGSLKTIFLAAQAIRAGDAEVMVAGGVEHMSNAAYLLPKGRWGHRLGHGQLMDQLVFFDPLSGNTMGETAENVAEKYGISRQDQDAFAVLSQKKAALAMEQGLFEEQIVPVEIPQKKGAPIYFQRDEHPRPGVTVEDLARLKPVFKENGTVTAGNSSGMNDGAAAVVVTSGQKAKEMSWKPLATILGYASVGVEPSLMGIGPIFATRKLMQNLGISVGDIDLIELNEAFASQSLACIRELKLDPEKVNIQGGAIALGHPISATGAVILTKLIHQMRRSGKELGLATMCLAGGQGVAILIRSEI